MASARSAVAGAQRHVALLRAVNVGGHNRVAMHALCAMLTDMGLTRVESLLQSGNLVFDSASVSGSELERLLAQQAKQQLGLDTEFFVRTALEWVDLVARNPLRGYADIAPSQLLVVCLPHAPELQQRLELEAAPRGVEQVRVVGRQAYVWYPEGMGKSRLKLPIVGTGRNWNTVLKLADRVQA